MFTVRWRQRGSGIDQLIHVDDFVIEIRYGGCNQTLVAP